MRLSLQILLNVVATVAILVEKGLAEGLGLHQFDLFVFVPSNELQSFSTLRIQPKITFPINIWVILRDY